MQNEESLVNQTIRSSARATKQRGTDTIEALFSFKNETSMQAIPDRHTIELLPPDGATLVHASFACRDDNMINVFIVRKRSEPKFLFLDLLHGSR